MALQTLTKPTIFAKIKIYGIFSLVDILYMPSLYTGETYKKINRLTLLVLSKYTFFRQEEVKQ